MLGHREGAILVADLALMADHRVIFAKFIFRERS
jgi:hypothetical protein